MPPMEVLVANISWTNQPTAGKQGLPGTVGGRRNRMFKFAPYLDLFEDEAEAVVVQPTQHVADPE